MKAHIARTLEGLSEACDALSVCARYDPSTGYSWSFEQQNDEEEEDDNNVLAYEQGMRRRKRRRVLDNKRSGER